MERQTVRIEIARPEGEESHMHIKVEKILNGYIVRVLLPGFPEYDEPLFFPMAPSLVKTHCRAVMEAWVKGEQADTEEDYEVKVIAERALFAMKCDDAKRIIAKARAGLGVVDGGIGESIAYLLAHNMPNLSVLEIQAVMKAIGEE